MSSPRVLFLVRRVGPYHDARFNAAGRRLDLTVVETRPGSTEYPWTTAAGAHQYRLAAFRPAEVAEDGLRGAALTVEVEQALQTYRPEVVACAGWADPEYHALLQRCFARTIPAVVMSDSTYSDEPRQWWRELVKGSLVRNFTAAVVAGSRSQDYLQRLGFPGRAIFWPWDVVDNAHFAAGADRFRANRDRMPEAAVAVPRCFLCVARFILKKNLEGLLSAYAAYVAEAGASAWDLVLSGAGPLESGLRGQVVAAGLTTRVKFAGFSQYPDLPGLYARAGALVLPSWSDQWGLVVNEAMAAGVPVIVSRRCGCAADLVHEGVNGMVFDPDKSAELAGCLGRLAQLDSAQWSAMGRRSREIIAAYTPETFASGLAAAVTYAIGRKKPASPALSHVVVRLLAARGGRTP
jgi:1,2-diacylglycerol 3-alpha-glucosyltransferase